MKIATSAQMQALDRAAPARFRTPLGHEVAIDYSGEGPEISVRLQEMFGVSRMIEHYEDVYERLIAEKRRK